MRTRASPQSVGEGLLFREPQPNVEYTALADEKVPLTRALQGEFGFLRGRWSVGRLLMHGFIKRFANGCFYPEEEAVLTAAFDDAWAKLQASRAPFAEEVSAAREVLAKQIIMAAQRGERNPGHLTQDALLPFSRQKLSLKAAA